MDRVSNYLYFSRMATNLPPGPASEWTFQLLSIPKSHHAAGDHFTRAPQWNSDLHLVHTIAGRGILHVDGRAFETTPDAVLAVPVFQACHWEKAGSEAWTMINFHARIYEAGSTPLHERRLLPTRFSPAGLDDVHVRLARWHDAWNSGDSLRRTGAASGVLGLLSAYLTTHGLAGPEPGEDALTGHVRHLLEGSADRAFDAGKLAREAGLSISQLNRRFRASLGISPKAYWHVHRLARAQSLLLETPDSIGTIAETLGFSDVYYFSRWFRDRSGLPPTEFRKQRQLM